ncbi:MAG: sulfite exporter TauE/SafE family protein [Candidatus Hydrogenedentes bacterium]|nr:sulfite exporter TauE/SafE family protein [Candidatus Hydrogenedentota bacterium]
MQEYLLVAVFIGMGTFVQGVAGFGSALVSMPLITLLISVQAAAPVQTITSLIVSFHILYFTHASLRWREALLMTLGSFAGLPFGLYLLRVGAPTVILKILGTVLIVNALFELFLAPRIRPANDVEPAHSAASMFGALVAGAIAGVLGGAYAANGPPAVMYGVMRRWPRDAFKSILQAFFIVSNVVAIGGYAVGGFLDGHVLRLIVWSMPAVFLGLLAGRWVDVRLHPRHFRTAVVVLTLVLGVSLMFR